MVNSVPAPQPRRRIIVVLGMHRSGTSVTTNLLGELGVPLSDDLMPATGDNQRGYFESLEISKLHDDVLGLFGLKWSTPTTLRALPHEWWKLPAVASFRSQLARIVARELADRTVWAFKDPRTARLIPLWNEVIAQLGLDAKFVLVTRHPLEVAGSLFVRDRLDPVIGELLWVEHNADAMLQCGKRIDAIVEYQDWIDKPLVQARYMIDRLGLDYAAGDAELKAIVDRVIAPDLRRQAASGSSYRLPFTGPFYTALRSREVAAASSLSDIFNIARGFTNVIASDLYRRVGEVSNIANQRAARIAALEHQLRSLTTAPLVSSSIPPVT
jgi:hypothetical protein